MWVDVVEFSCVVGERLSLFQSPVCRPLALRGERRQVFTSLHVGSYHCNVSFCALFLFTAEAVSTVWSLPSCGATNLKSEIPTTWNKLLINSPDPPPPPLSHPLLPMCFSLETSRMWMGGGKTDKGEEGGRGDQSQRGGLNK